MKRPLGINLVIVWGIIGALTVCLYWMLWFLAPDSIQARGPEAPDYEIYVNFEGAFPLADAWLAAAALVGVVGLWKMRDWGFLFTTLAFGAAIFLGLMDLLYDIEHQMFSPLNVEAAVELAIVLLNLILNPLGIVILWRHRRRLIC